MYELQKLSHVHRHMVEMVLDGQDSSVIAKAMGKSEIGVRGIINSPLFQDALAKRRAERNRQKDEAVNAMGVKTVDQYTRAQEILDKSLADAAAMQVQLMFSENEGTAQRAIESIFKETWGKREKDKQNNNTQLTINLPQASALTLHAAFEEAFGKPAEKEFIIGSNNDSVPSIVEGSTTDPERLITIERQADNLSDNLLPSGEPMPERRESVISINGHAVTI